MQLPYIVLLKIIWRLIDFSVCFILFFNLMYSSLLFSALLYSTFILLVHSLLPFSTLHLFSLGDKAERPFVSGEPDLRNTMGHPNTDDVCTRHLSAMSTYTSE